MLVPYYEKSNVRLFLGDSTKVLADLPEKSVDLIFADPPYLLSNGGFSVQNGKRVSVHKGDWDRSKGVENDFEFHKNWISACRRVLKPNGSIWISGTYHSIYACGFALQLGGWKILNDISWFKPNAAPNLSCRYFTASHETLIWARRDPDGRHRFNYDMMKNGTWHREDFLKKEGKQMRSVWTIGTPKAEEKIFGKHPTQKPVELLRRIVVAASKRGDTVLDPFTGSSTTGMVAAPMGRKYIGVDMDAKYLDLSIKRFEALKP